MIRRKQKACERFSENYKPIDTQTTVTKLIANHVLVLNISSKMG